MGIVFFVAGIFLIYIIVFNIFQKIKHGTLDWKEQIETDTVKAVARYSELSEETLVLKIDLKGKNDNNPIYHVLRNKGTIKSLLWLIQTYQTNTIGNNSSLNKYHFLLTIDIIAKRINFELPENIKSAISLNNPMNDL